jgi:glycosyltransferase involved in cell wall biosynthesis
MRPIRLPSNILINHLSNNDLAYKLDNIRIGIESLAKSNPEVSIVIPAYNEEGTILMTLSSLSQSTTKRSVEIIVVNNNSMDKTGSLAEAAGAICILETERGITSARNAGLRKARGKYILNADADTFYSPGWIEELSTALDDNSFGIVYGSFSFIPTTETSRIAYYLYEHSADFMRWLNRVFREEAMNVYGFNSGFRREQGLAVGGFNHPKFSNEDGWLALKIRNQGFGKILFIASRNALVWITDRRIQMDGGLWRGVAKRVKRMISPNSNYM